MKKAKPMDAVLVILLALVSFLPLTGQMLRPTESPSTLQVSTPEGTQEYALDSREIAIDSHGYHLTLTVTPDGVEVSSSDCQDHTCMKTGKITRAGSAIVCVPARVRIELLGEEDYDAITG